MDYCLTSKKRTYEQNFDYGNDVEESKEKIIKITTDQNELNNNTFNDNNDYKINIKEEPGIKIENDEYDYVDEADSVIYNNPDYDFIGNRNYQNLPIANHSTRAKVNF
jgi:hypothetical protein